MEELFIPLADYIGMTIIASFLGFVFSLAFFDNLKIQRLTDRYRLKYGFDKDIESKEIESKHDIDLKLERRERRFKRRVFKD